jgi:hypothetical protein
MSPLQHVTPAANSILSNALFLNSCGAKLTQGLPKNYTLKVCTRHPLLQSLKAIARQMRISAVGAPDPRHGFNNMKNTSEIRDPISLV